jgi:hypothetical protein
VERLAIVVRERLGANIRGWRDDRQLQHFRRPALNLKSKGLCQNLGPI